MKDKLQRNLHSKNYYYLLMIINVIITILTLGLNLFIATYITKNLSNIKFDKITFDYSEKESDLSLLSKTL